MPKTDLIGKRFERLTIVKEVAALFYDNGQKVRQFACVCDCGTKKVIRYNNLKSKSTKSCGCLRKENSLKKENLVGRRFEKLVVLKEATPKVTPKGRKCIRWVCRCDCGKTTIAHGNNLKKGDSKSCGCIKSKNPKRQSAIYNVWKNMKSRCYNKNHPQYKDWGGRGITICKKWENDYIAFYNWCIKNGYKKGLEIDRENNDGNYEPSNCRFVTSKTQANNVRSNRVIKYKGKKMTMSQWADFLNIPYPTLASRLNKLQWSIKRALTN